MRETDWIVLVSIGFLLILLKAIFIATEFSVIRLRFSHFNTELVKDIEEGKRFSRLLYKSDRALRFLRLGSNFFTLLLGVVLVPLVHSLASATSFPTERGGLVLLFGLVILLTMTLHYQLGHLVPRGIALQNPVGVLNKTSWFVWLLQWMCSPLLRAMDLFSKMILRIVRLEPHVSFSKLDLESQINNLDESEGPPDFTQRVFRNVISMRGLIVQDVMLPRNQIQYFDIYDGNEVNVSLAKGAGHTRYPLCEGDLDNCIGIIHIKDLFQTDLETLRLDLKKMGRAVIYVGPDDHLESVLEKLLESKQHMALVRDEFGGTVGAITMENIVEELVGNIQDEFDSEAEQIEEVQEDVFIVDGLTPIHDVEEKLDMEIEEEEVSTIGGLITSELGKIPDAGQTIRLNNLEIEAVEVDEKRVLTARVRVIPNRKEED